MQPHVDKQKLVAVRRRIFQIERLASMPQVLWQLVDAISDDETHVSDLTRLIEADPALTAKILHLANSSFYGFSRQITTIRRAVVVMGFEELRVLAIGVGLAEVFDLKKSVPGFEPRNLWIHSLAVSWLSRALAESAGYPVPTEVSVSGLLHDLGKWLLAAHLDDELAELLEWLEKDVPYYLAEEHLGLNHTIIGHWLAVRWGLPQVHAAAIRDHHTPRAGEPYSTSTCLVALANHLAVKLNYDMKHESRPLNVPLVLKQTQLNEARVKAVMRRSKETLPTLLAGWDDLMSRGDWG
jgi:putative nucleotidyltransferase with HDIG domain